MSQVSAIRTISCCRKIEYEIISCLRIFDIGNRTLADIGAGKGSKRFIVLDKNVKEYRSAITSYFDYYGIKTRISLFESGESNKTIQRAVKLLKELDQFPILRRSEPLVAIGGGVLTDMVGFAASIYRRGVPHIKIPTTLMGYVDAAIGIKCGVNLNNGKNRIGSFEPPLKVLLDPDFLRTLSNRQILNGVGEIIKLAIISDAKLFNGLELLGNSCVQKKFQGSDCKLILDRSINAMLDNLASNLYEEDLSRSVDFGHTFSLAYEMELGNDLLHGEAVVVDVILSIFLAKTKGVLAAAAADRILKLIGAFDYDFSRVFLKTEILWASLLERQKHRDGQQRIPLPCGVGKHVFANDVTYEELDRSNGLLKDWIYEGRNLCERRFLRAG